MNPIRKLLPLIFASAMIIGAISLTAGLANADQRCTGTLNEKAVCQAREQVDKKCVWTGDRSKTLDCARLTYDAYREAGLKETYRSPAGEYGYGAKMKWTVAAGKRRAGDLLFFDSRGKGVDRVGLYIGDNRMIFATGTPSEKKRETIKVTQLTAAHLKQLQKLAVRPVATATRAEPEQVVNGPVYGGPMPAPDGTDPCGASDGTTPDETVPTNDQNGDEEPAPDDQQPDEQTTDQDEQTTDQDEPPTDDEQPPDQDQQTTDQDEPPTDDEQPPDQDQQTTDEQQTTDDSGECADGGGETSDEPDDCLDTDDVGPRVVAIVPEHGDDKPGYVEPSEGGGDAGCGRP